MNRSLIACLLTTLVWPAMATDASAQVVNRPDTRPLPGLPDDFARQDDSFPRPRRGDERPLPHQGDREDQPGFLLNGVRFEGNTVFDDQQLAAVLKPFLGRRTTIEDLEAMRQALSRHHVDAGFVNSGALVPRQRIVGGVVLFQIVEGRLSAVRPFGEDIGDAFGLGGQLSPDYITDRLAIAPDQPLNVEALRERFGLLLEDRLVERLRGELKPGPNPGDSILDLEVEVRDPVEASLSFNNHNSVSNGAYGVDGALTVFNVTGRGDVSSFRVTKTEGRFDGFGRLEIPLLAGEFTPFVEARYAASDVIEAPFDQLDIENGYWRVAAGTEWRAYQDAENRVDLTFSADRTSSETRLLDMPFPPSGVDGNILSAYALRFSQGWVRRRADDVLALRSTFSLGLDVFDATKGEAGAGDGDYVSWLGQAQYVRRLSDEARLLGRFQAQFAGAALPSFEQIGIGGVDTVRGYRQNAVSRDNALIFTLEAPVFLTDLPIPGLTQPGERAPLEVTPFADYGSGWNVGEGFSSRTDLFGVGLGLKWRASPNLSVDLVYSRSLIDDSEIARGSDLTDEAVYLSITLFTN